LNKIREINNIPEVKNNKIPSIENFTKFREWILQKLDEIEKLINKLNYL